MSAQLAAKVAKDAKKSHKDRVAEFNAKLEALSEVSFLLGKFLSRAHPLRSISMFSASRC
jgi:hypothetical protein